LGVVQISWTAPKTYAGNSSATSADRNTYERDNLNWLANDHPRCRVTRATSLSITTGTDTAITFPTEVYDVGAMHDTGSNPDHITVPSGGAGIYIISGYYQMAAPGGSFTRSVAWLRVNDSTNIATSVVTPPTSTGPADSITALVNLAVGDYVELIVNHNTGSSVSVTDAALAANWIAF